MDKDNEMVKYGTPSALLDEDETLGNIIEYADPQEKRLLIDGKKKRQIKDKGDLNARNINSKDSII